MRKVIGALAVFVAVGGHVANAEPAGLSPYAGQQTRAIKSLSAKDIEDLRNGRGWGLAKVAELNGMPGPAHLLELREKIALTPRQIERIEALYRAMNAKAMDLGARLIELERALNDSFADRSVTRESLDARLAEIAAVRKELRLAHLETHLETPALLTGDQIAAYNRLRGYTGGGGHGGRHHRHDG